MYNETIYHPEVAVFRAATGGAYNLIGAYGVMVSGAAFPAKGSIPIGTGKTGTILSTGKTVRGTSTRFFDQMKIGDYLYQKEVVRRIVSIESNTLLTLDQAFPTDISVAVIPILCESQFYKAINIKNVHASTAAIVQGAPLSAGNVMLTGGAPLSFDATSGTLEFTLHK